MRNWKLWGVIVVYAILVVAQIHWGIPGPDHPFTYQMDEWHSLQSIRFLFKYGSVNIIGAAHGTLLYFALAGAWLIPFWIGGYINPLAIKSIVDNLPMQYRLFEALRLNTLAWGILALVMMYKLTRDWRAVSLFTITPIWLTLSGLFKYDIAVVAAILTTLYFCQSKSWRLAGVITGLAMGIKIALLPLVGVYALSLWMNKRNLLMGLVIMAATFLITGIPDVFWRWEGYLDVLKVNLVTNSQPAGIYLVGQQFGYIFGYALYGLFGVAIIRWLKRPRGILIMAGLVMFAISLVPLGLGAGGNRALVLLPFMVLIIALFKWPKWLLAIGLTAQIWQSTNILAIKFAPDVRRVASEWMLANLPRDTVVGVENIPIYQYLPDVVMNGTYKYQVIDGKLPKIVIVTNEHQELLQRLTREGYTEQAIFRPQMWKSVLDFKLANLIPTPTAIGIYTR
ncbi:MAG: hypothetical protein UX80_C0001G0019 [Candidatus Amesbacteria bacterium GW2011_GWA2_47_11b]|uniref:Glycosyltransferase RgtA/B/C/D-like domain-containing protein n=3 Tax=Candidatus Amesiibacteriota TaxID=1752730 RepID=A0A0G1SL37_9BACT|nr:MAG: hypothetical protein UX42_C0013G0012 [Microgenomates group bacterium GW2011_GWC1_46_20]KKU58580.1 MAG: hypothetical protein UX80_C0001G0019 [Candidatus Amesbacteria bacterium GW2011_GWA2_47_11b]KKU70147.1 MAG: hypothetical protein UX92_C0004G0024 [Candidatus Amesbacteria bacterium GW2011_GWA1_47_20]KKU84672.1 MAG: hypothetical protein UY11_C0005G0046 [Candidatus Amesbacteria bacterium GW2011_GWC2_47_8]